MAEGAEVRGLIVMAAFGREHGGLLKLRSSATLVMLTGASLYGCWTPPQIPDHPPDPPGVIAQGLRATTTRTDLVVQSVDSTRHTITFFDTQDGLTITYGADADIGRLAALHVGQRVKAKLVAQLTVYVRGPDQSAPPDVANAPSIAATVAAVDPSYRLMTVQLRGGHRDTFKLPLGVQAKSMHSGDDVAIRPDQVVTLSSDGSPRGPHND